MWITCFAATPMANGLSYAPQDVSAGLEVETKTLELELFDENIHLDIVVHELAHAWHNQLPIKDDMKDLLNQMLRPDDFDLPDYFESLYPHTFYSYVKECNIKNDTACRTREMYELKMLIRNGVSKDM